MDNDTPASPNLTLRKPRRTDTAGYARGHETRQRILQAALSLFSQKGFEGTSTRDIVARSDSNMSTLQYYFGSKDGLYLACAEEIAGLLKKGVGAPPPPEPSETREAVLQRLCDALDRQMDYVVSVSPHSRFWSLFMAREQMNPEPGEAFNIIHDNVTGPNVTAYAYLVGRLLNRPPEDPIVIARTFALLGQVIFFRSNYPGALRMMGWSSFDQEKLEILKQAVREQVRATFSVEGR